jgi:hypothetical protein
MMTLTVRDRLAVSAKGIPMSPLINSIPRGPDPEDEDVKSLRSGTGWC